MMWKRGEAECMVHLYTFRHLLRQQIDCINVSNANSLWNTESQRIAFGCLPNIYCTVVCCLPRFDMTSTLSWEYTCTEGSHTPNETASACRNALVCTAYFSAHKQSWFASCTVQPEPSAVDLSKGAPAKAITAQVRSVVSQHVRIFHFEHRLYSN